MVKSRDRNLGAPLVLALDIDPIHEDRASANERDQVGRIDSAPARLIGIQQLAAIANLAVPLPAPLVFLVP